MDGCRGSGPAVCLSSRRGVSARYHRAGAIAGHVDSIDPLTRSRQNPINSTRSPDPRRARGSPGRHHKEARMAHVSVHYKVYLTAGHHRQPRNQSAELEPNAPSEVDVTNPGNITPLYIPQLPYTVSGNSGLAQLLFWSVT